MKTFKQYLAEQGFLKNIFNQAKNVFQSKSDSGEPRTGDKLKIFYLYKGNGTYLVSNIEDGILRIEKDGSVSIQWDNNYTSKIAQNIQQANLIPDGVHFGRRSWKINRKLD